MEQTPAYTVVHVKTWVCIFGWNLVGRLIEIIMPMAIDKSNSKPEIHIYLYILTDYCTYRFYRE